jgi:hypothetical protein
MYSKLAIHARAFFRPLAFQRLRMAAVEKEKPPPRSVGGACPFLVGALCLQSSTRKRCARDCRDNVEGLLSGTPQSGLSKILPVDRAFARTDLHLRGVAEPESDVA